MGEQVALAVFDCDVLLEFEPDGVTVALSVALVDLVTVSVAEMLTEELPVEVAECVWECDTVLVVVAVGDNEVERDATDLEFVRVVVTVLDGVA